MAEVFRDYTPGVTNSVGYELITPRSENFPKIQYRNGRFHRRVDIQLHLGAMELQTATNPNVKAGIQQFMDDVQVWRGTLSKIGLWDFDVKNPEDLVDRVSEFKRGVSVKRAMSENVETPGFLHLRRDVAALVPAALLSLLLLSHTNVYIDSNARTSNWIKDKCAVGLLRIQEQQTDQYVQLAASQNIPENADPFGFVVQQCSGIGRAFYDGKTSPKDILPDPDSIVMDRERGLRAGYLGLVAIALTTTIVSGFSATRRLYERMGVQRLLSRRESSPTPEVVT